MKIGIINAGNIGRTLASAWYRTGHELFLAKAGSQEKLLSFVEDHHDVCIGDANEAAKFGKVSLFSVYWPNLESTLKEVGEMKGKIVIDTMNPLLVNERFEHYHDVEFMRESSTSEVLQSRLPHASVVKAFSSIPSDALNAKMWEKNGVRPSVFIAGDDPKAKEIVVQLTKDAGFHPLDVGKLKNARSIEQLGILFHHVAENHYKGEFQNLAPAILRATS